MLSPITASPSSAVAGSMPAVSSDVGRRVWVLNPEPTGHHIFAGELNAKNFLVPPAAETGCTWAHGLKQPLDALLPEGPLADENQALPLPTLRNVPTPNARFTGRGATLLRTHSKLFPPQIGSAAMAPAVYLYGMAGLGKTEVAAKYAHKLTGSRIDKPNIPTGRSAPTAVSDIDLTVQPGQILVLELPDGTTLITSGKRLKKG